MLATGSAARHTTSSKTRLRSSAALPTQRNIDEAGKSIGIASNTLLKWMKQPEFLTAYREARRDAFRQSIARLQQGTSAAGTTLLKTMIDPAVFAVALGDGCMKRVDDGGKSPLVELLHEAHFSLFGHMFVPFGKSECFGGGQLALVAARMERAAGYPAVS